MGAEPNAGVKAGYLDQASHVVRHVDFSRIFTTINASEARDIEGNGPTQRITQRCRDSASKPHFKGPQGNYARTPSAKPPRPKPRDIIDTVHAFISMQTS